MEIAREELEDCQVQLMVEVPDADVQAAMQAAARRLANRTRIPGFRPGKAPYDMVVRRVGEEAVFEEALDRLGQDVYHKALEETGIEPYAQGSLQDVASRQPLQLKYLIPLEPQVDLGAYQDRRIPFEGGQVTDEALEAFLDELRQQRAVIEPVDRPAELGDVIDARLKGVLVEEGNEPSSTLLDEQEAALLIDEDSAVPFRGAAAQLAGIAAGEQRELEHTFPEDYPNENLRGKLARFNVACLQVKSRTVPEWSNDFAKSLGDFDDLLDLRAKARSSLEEQAAATAEREYSRKVIDRLVDEATIKYPPVLLRDEEAGMLRDLDRRLRGQNLSLEDYLRIERKTLDDLRKEVEPEANLRVRRALAIGKVIDLEGLTIDAKEIDAHIDELISAFDDEQGELRKAFESPAGRQRIATDLMYDKAVGRLVAHAKGNVTPTEPQPTEES